MIRFTAITRFFGNVQWFSRLLLVNLSLIFLLTGFISCESENSDSQTFRYVNLEFYEDFSNGNNLALNFQTVETFPCSNFKLMIYETRHEGMTSLQIDDIEVPDICITETAPASSLAVYNDITSNKKFQILIGDKEHNIEFHYTDSTIAVQKMQVYDEHLFLAFNTLYRVPQNTAWGYVVINELNITREEVQNTLMESLTRLGAKQITLNDGNYYYFQIDEGKILFNNESDNTFGFYVNYEGPINNLIESFEETDVFQQNKTIRIRLFNTNGERYVM